MANLQSLVLENGRVKRIAASDVLLVGNGITVGSGNLLVTGVAGSAVVVNEAGVDVDFRIEGVGITHLFYVDAGVPQVRIGSYLDAAFVATPGSFPSAGFSRIYPKSDGNWYQQTAGGVETQIGGSAGVTDHGALTGLADDDHAQYLLVSGTRAMTGALNMASFAVNFTSQNASISVATSPQFPGFNPLLLDGGDDEFVEIIGEVFGNGSILVDASAWPSMATTSAVIEVAGDISTTNMTVWGASHATKPGAAELLLFGSNAGSGVNYVTSRRAPRLSFGFQTTAGADATPSPEWFGMNGAEAVINEPGSDVDFRVEAVGETSVFMVDAANARIAMGTPTPTSTLHVFRSSGTALTQTIEQQGNAAASLEVTTANTTRSSHVIVSNTSGGAIGTLSARGATATGVSGSLFGIALSDIVDFSSTGASGGLLFGTRDATPIIMGVNGDAGTAGERARITTTSVVFNENGGDVDLRVEGDTETNLFVVDAGLDNVGIGTATPGSRLDVTKNFNGNAAVSVTNTTSGTAAQASLYLINDGAGGRYASFAVTSPTWTTAALSLPNQYQSITSTGLANGILLATQAANAPIVLSVPVLAGDGVTLTAERLRVTATAVIINDTGADVDFRVEGDTRANLLLVDAATDRVGINRAAGTHGATLDIDNLAIAESIFIARDNGTAVFTIADGGAVTGTSSISGATFLELTTEIATPSASAAGGKVYVKSDNKLYFLADTGPEIDLTLGAGVATTVSIDTTLGASHQTVFVDATGAARTMTLPTAVGIAGRRYDVKKIDATANTVTIDGNTTQTIDGALTQVISAQYASLTVVSDGANWFIV